ncbi:MAG: DedA family protein [Actinomycetes bacterium]
MHTTTLAVNWLSAHSLIDAFSTAGVIAIVFAETGLLFGLFLPGDSLLVTAGIAAGGHLAGIHLSLAALLIGCPIAAILGSQLGYWIGLRTGPVLFRKPEARLFKPEYVERTAVHLDRFGVPKAIFLARFVPIVRTVLSPLAGAAKVPWRTFTLWNVLSGLVWTIAVILIGYTVGRSVHNIDHYVLPVVVIVVIVSLVPLVRELRRSRR